MGSLGLLWTIKVSKITIAFCVLSFTVSSQCLLTMPMEETFDLGSTPACWTNSGAWLFGNAGTVGFPSPNIPGIDDHTGNSGYFVWMDASSGSSFGSLMSPVISDSNLATKGISFWYHLYSGNSFTSNNFIAIDLFDGLNWILFVDTIFTNSPYWRFHSIDISGYPITDSLQVRFRGVKLNLFQDIIIDDINIGTYNSCLPPQTISFSAIKAGSAVIDIVDASSSLWEYEHGPAGFALGTGFRDTTSAQQFSINSLLPLNNYQVYVRRICSPGDTSVWYRAEFSTICGSLVAPFIETFDSITIPSCWTTYPLTGPNGFAFSQLEDFTNNGGRSASKINDFSAVLQSPYIDISQLSNPALRFFMKLKARNQARPALSYDHLEVSVSNDSLSWIQLGTLKTLDQNWQEQIFPIDKTTFGDSIMLRFTYLAFANPNGDLQSDLFLDDISVAEIPACLSPTDSAFFTGVGQSSATVNFNQSTSKEMEYGLIGFERGTGTSISLTGNQQFITGLIPGSYYVVYYRDSCGAGYGPWSKPYHFKTLCATKFSVPYSQSFNSMTYQSTDFSTVCWSSYSNGIDAWRSGDSPSTLTGPGGRIDGQYAYIEGDLGAVGNVSYLESPWIDLKQINQLQLKFYYFMYGSDIGELYVEVLHNNTWDSIPFFGTIKGQQQTSESQPWLFRIIDLTGFSDSIKIRFKAIKGSGKYSDIAIDKISLYDTCLVSDPVAAFSFQFDSLTTAGQYVTFTSIATNANGYFWDFDDGTLDTGNAVQHIYSSNGTFNVSHRVENLCGIADSLSDTIEISKVDLPKFIPSSSDIHIYPNPCVEKILIKVSDGKHMEFCLLSITGEQLTEWGNLSSENHVVSLKGLPDGVYFMHFRSSQIHIKRRIVKYSEP